jgi:hypothetical protein
MLGILFSSIVIVLGIAILMLSIAPSSEKLEALLNMPDTFRSLIAILLPRNGGMCVVDASEMSYTLRIPCESGWFWYQGTPQKGFLFFAPVPLGFIAKLPGDDTLSQRRFTDSSSICVVRDLAGADVSAEAEKSKFTNIEVLQRCRRWQIIVDGSEGFEIRTRHDIIIRAHVAVQTSIDIELDDPQLSVVFSDHRNYIRAVESHILRTLRRFASRWDYSKLVTNTEEIIAELNEGWGKLMAGEEETPPTPSCRLIRTLFSGFALKPYTEQEEARLQRVLTEQVTASEKEYRDLQTELSTWTKNLRAQLTDPMKRLDESIKMFTGFAEVKEATANGDLQFYVDDSGGFASRLKNQLSANARSMKNQRDPNDFHKSASELIPRLQADLIQQCDDIVANADSFTLAVGYLKEQESECLKEASQKAFKESQV